MSAITCQCSTLSNAFPCKHADRGQIY
ncbi:hypothetical protein [Piscirickettsia salmonis]